MHTLKLDTKTLRRLGIMVALVAIYFITGKLGLRLAFINNSATAVWPPTGIAIAAVILFGYDMLPAIFVGAFLVNLTTAGGVATSLGIASGNMLEALAAAWLVNKYANGKQAFESPGNVFRFAVWAGFIATAIAATVGSMMLLVGGLASLGSINQVWLTWWLGDAAGALVFAPFLILFFEGGSYHWKSEDNTAAGIFLIFLLAATGIIFERFVPAPFNGYPLAFLVVPPLLWASFRFGRRVTSATMILLATVAVAAAFNEPPPFDGFVGAVGANVNLLYLQFFLSFVSVCSLIFAVTTYCQRKDERALARNERHFRSLVENSSDGILLMDAAGAVSYVSPAVRHIVGYAPEDLVGALGRNFIFTEDRTKYDSFAENLARHPHVAATLEIRAVQKDGSPRWVEFAAVNLLRDSAVEAVVVNFRDITERKEIAAAKNNFISSVSYRLSPPLAQAETYIAALRERKKAFSPLEQKYLAELDTANQKMIRLTSDIIRLARIELGTICITSKVLDLRKIVDEALRAAAPAAQVKGIRFIWKHPPARTFITADQNLLELALQRLMAKCVSLAAAKGKINITLLRNDYHVALHVFSPSIRDLRKKMQMSQSQANTGQADPNDVSFGFYMIQSLIELMEGKMYFEPGVDGEVLVVIFPKSVAEAGGGGTADGSVETTAENQSARHSGPDAAPQ